MPQQWGGAKVVQSLQFHVELTLEDKARLLRVAQHWTQVALATAAGVKQIEVSRLERGLPIQGKAKNRILRVLGLDTNGCQR